MALWNRNSQRQGTKVAFTLFLLTASLALMIVTVCIPGFILFSQSTVPSGDTHVIVSSTAVVQSSPMASPTTMPTSTSTVAACSTALPATITPAPTISERPGDNSTNVQANDGASAMQNSTVYAGVPAGSVAHARSVPTPTATAVPGKIQQGKKSGMNSAIPPMLQPTVVYQQDAGSSAPATVLAFSSQSSTSPAVIPAHQGISLFISHIQRATAATSTSRSTATASSSQAQTSLPSCTGGK